MVEKINSRISYIYRFTKVEMLVYLTDNGITWYHKSFYGSKEACIEQLEIEYNKIIRRD